jgi:hypothetical protein
MARSIFGGVRHQPYEPVYNAIADLGGSIRQGFRDVSDARQTAADFALKTAQVNAGLKRDELAMPGLLAKKKEAENYLAEQQKLDQPMDTAYMSNALLGANPEGYTLNHFFGNDVPGALLKMTGSTYNKETDTYHGPDGRALTRRDFQQHGPAIQATMVAKTDPLKMGQDMLDAARARDDHAQVSAIKKQINNPQWMMNQYDKQLQYLINAKGGMTQMGYDMTTINESMDRIYKKQERLGDTMDLDRRLQVKQSQLKFGMTPKEITDVYMTAYEQVDKDLAARRELGDMEGMSPEQIHALRRKLAGDRVQDALLAAGMIKPSKPGDSAGVDTTNYRTPPTGKKPKGFIQSVKDIITGDGKNIPKADTKSGFWETVNKGVKRLDVTDEAVQERLVKPSKKGFKFNQPPGIPTGGFGNRYRRDRTQPGLLDRIKKGAATRGGR